MVKILQKREIPGKGFGFVAVKDISIGTSLASEYPSHFTLSPSSLKKYCSACLCPFPNLQQCSLCKIICYCSPECQRKDWTFHKYECKVISEAMPGFVRLCIRTLVKLKNVEKFQSMFSNLLSNYDKAEEEQKIELGRVAYFLNSQCNLSMAMARDTIETLCRVKINCLGITAEDLNPIASGIYPTLSAFNHSCSPNACYVHVGNGRMNVVAVKDIKAEEEITITYISSIAPKKSRQKQLKKNYLFDCNCDFCCKNEHEEALTAWICQSCMSPSAFEEHQEENQLPTVRCRKCFTVVPAEIISDVIRFKRLVFLKNTPNKNVRLEELKNALTIFQKFLGKFHVDTYHTAEMAHLLAISLHEYQIGIYCVTIMESHVAHFLSICPERFVYLTMLGKLNSYLKNDEIAMCHLNEAIKIGSILYPSDYKLLIECSELLNHLRWEKDMLRQDYN